MMNCLNKPNKVCMCQFVQSILLLNSYTEDLPCLFYSPCASSHMQKVKSFTDAELSCNIMCMCPLK